MNKIQIKAEFLVLLSKLEAGNADCLDNLEVLKNCADENYIVELALKEALAGDDRKISALLFVLNQVIVISNLEELLWNYIKDNEYPDSMKIAAFNLLSRLNPECNYLSVKEYIADIETIIEDETKEVLSSALMNPEAQIDFMDFLKSISEDDKIALMDSLKEDYEGDALANILIPVYLHAPESKEGFTALELLGETRSQLAYHALEESLGFVCEELKPVVNKNLSKLKLSGIRVDETIQFYKEVLSVSAPYKSIISYPDGHGNMALIFTRKRYDDGSIQLWSVVINSRYGILDSFGFNQISEDEYLMVKDKFVSGSRCVAITPEFVKYLLLACEKLSRDLGEVIPYEYICWRSILSDIEIDTPDMDFASVELSKVTLEEIENLDFIERWFFDVYTSDEFADLITKLDAKLRANQFNTDFEAFIERAYEDVFTSDEVAAQNLKIKLAAYLKRLEGNEELAAKLFALTDNSEFFKNILRKSIYEHYVGRLWQLKNENKAVDAFTRRAKAKSGEFKKMELGLIVSAIESVWVKNV